MVQVYLSCCLQLVQTILVYIDFLTNYAEPCWFLFPQHLYFTLCGIVLAGFAFGKSQSDDGTTSQNHQLVLKIMFLS